MYISRVVIDNYRTFVHSCIPLNNGLSVIVGENNVGKSNLLEALSLIFISNYSWKRRKLSQEDFHNELVINNQWPSVKVEVTLSGIHSDEELALCCRWLTREPEVARLTYVFRPKANIRDNPPKGPTPITDIKLPLDQYEWVLFGGEQETTDTFDHQLLAKFSLEYVGALRDATAELRKSSGRLYSMVRSHPQDDANKATVLEKLTDLNSQIQKSSEVAKAQTTINTYLRNVSGSQHQKMEIKMTDNTYEDLLKDLRVLIGPANGKVHSLDTNGLGYNNLLYISILLSQYFGMESGKVRDYSFPILVVEEPEAHLHSLLQKYLGKYLFDGNLAGQVVMTSHSTHISSTADLDSLILMYKVHNKIMAKQVGTIFSQQDEDQKRYLERWLDATKSNIFFGRKVMLVEGIAERLLVPKLAELHFNKSKGSNDPLRTLDGEGISIISVDGVAFRPFLKLFGHEGLNMKCAVLTDSDPAKIETQNSEGEIVKVEAYPTKSGQYSACSRTSKLMDDYNDLPNIKVFTNLKTFEYDLILNDNLEFFRNIVHKHELGTSAQRKSIADLSDIATFARKVFPIISEEKGRVAQLVLDEIQAGSRLNIPRYITEAIDYLMEVE